MVWIVSRPPSGTGGLSVFAGSAGPRCPEHPGHTEVVAVVWCPGCGLPAMVFAKTLSEAATINCTLSSTYLVIVFMEAAMAPQTTSDTRSPGGTSSPEISAEHEEAFCVNLNFRDWSEGRA